MQELNIERAPSSPQPPLSSWALARARINAVFGGGRLHDSHSCLETLICTCRRLALIDPDILRTGSHHGDLAKQSEGEDRGLAV